ncbi:hypothetical protein [Parendozoicomonas haliclonae]|uniref:Uncharacterized protein n=1 Tax=Parendozoicomonas haliclonae TaxID=1960125 RepID=A0A1X7AIN4_9GAMM|nr:hypothetical protein [Parendozoicomonas haliclonae]SMA39270.1 hypothetical protein EHSB41UT_00996 [Parendozoicomonas haliclonae]
MFHLRILQVCLLLSGLMFGLAATAICTSTTCQQGTTSSGSIAVTLHPNEEARLWGLSHLNLGYHPKGNVYQAIISFCAFSSTGRGQITVNSQHSMSLIGPTGGRGSYQLWIAHIGASDWMFLNNGDAVAFNFEVLQPGEPCEGQSNIKLKAMTNVQNFRGLSNGFYTDILTVLLTPL